MSSRASSQSTQQEDKPRDVRQRSRESDDESDVPPLKRHRPILLYAKKRTTDELGIVAQLITQTTNMYWDPFTVVNAGVALLALDSEEDMDNEMESASERKKVLYNTFAVLCERIPGFVDTEDWDDVRDRLEDGKTAAKTEDNHTLKHAIVKWYPWSPALKPDSKSGCGTNHLECVKLLAPILLDWENAEVRHRFITLYDPPMTATQLPSRFLYENFEADRNHLAKGFLKSVLLVRAARAILFPISVANAEGGPDHQSNRKSKADIYGFSAVTPGFLAYVAVGVWYALSLETSFQTKGGLFDYERFYNDIVDSLNKPACKRDTDRLFEWWNRQLFPPKRTDPVAEPHSLVAELRRQAEECLLRDANDKN